MCSLKLLHKTARISSSILGHPKYLDEFTYADSDINDIILSCMNNLSLVGVSGRIFYGGNAAPVNKDMQIERIQGIIIGYCRSQIIKPYGKLRKSIYLNYICLIR